MRRGSVLRFLHISDLRLGRVFEGLADGSEQLRSALLAAPWQSAEACFQTAIDHDVDFVLLNGDVLPVDGGQGRALTFLREQFQRLAERGIELFWRTQDDPQIDKWIHCFDWSNCARFIPAHGVCQEFGRDGQIIAAISGEHGPGRPSEPFAIALLDSSAGSNAADYVGACGGTRDDLIRVGTTVHSPGRTWPANLEATGEHGCSLVEVDHNNCVSISLVPTSPTVHTEVLCSVSGTDPETQIRRDLDRITQDGRLNLITLRLEPGDAQAAEVLSRLDAEWLRRQLQQRTNGRPNWWVAAVRISVAVQAAVGHDAPECVRDFQHAVQERGSELLRAELESSNCGTNRPSAQMLNRVTRLGTSLLSPHN